MTVRALFPRSPRVVPGPALTCAALVWSAACTPPAPRQKAPAPVQKAKEPVQAPSAPKLLGWLDPQSALMLHWRPPQWDPDLLADLFAAPPALAFLYEHTQRQVQDTGRLLGKKVHASWRALSYVGPQSSRAITVLRVDPDTYGDLAKLDYPVQVHHEWRCFSLPQSYAQSLCLLEGSDLAWVDARAQALDLEALARARDLGSDAGIEEFRTVIETEPAPSLVAMSRAPLLHWELQEDPAQLLWTLSAYGQPDAQGLPGWKGVMRMGFASAVSQEAAKTLKSAKLLQSDATIAAQLRAKAHIAPLSDRSLEIRLEQHADAPAQP